MPFLFWHAFDLQSNRKNVRKFDNVNTRTASILKVKLSINLNTAMCMCMRARSRALDRVCPCIMCLHYTHSGPQHICTCVSVCKADRHKREIHTRIIILFVNFTNLGFWGGRNTKSISSPPIRAATASTVRAYTAQSCRPFARRLALVRSTILFVPRKLPIAPAPATRFKRSLPYSIN